MTDASADNGADTLSSKRGEEERGKGPSSSVVVVNCHGGRVTPTTADSLSLSSSEESGSSSNCLALEDKSIVYVKEDSIPTWLDTLVQMVCTYK